jgi:hypothetical protein
VWLHFQRGFSNSLSHSVAGSNRGMARRQNVRNREPRGGGGNGSTSDNAAGWVLVLSSCSNRPQPSSASALVLRLPLSTGVPAQRSPMSSGMMLLVSRVPRRP